MHNNKRIKIYFFYHSKHIWIDCCRNLRRDQYKGQDVNQKTMNKNFPLQDSISPQDMYDTVGDDTKYEDLGQLSGSSHYDQLELIKPS